MNYSNRKNKVGSKICIPLYVQEQTIAHIRECGSNNEEGFVAWSGVWHNSKLIVKSAIVPIDNYTKHYASMRFSDEIIESVADSILAKGEILIAQVHSHPFEAFHSITDNRYPLIHRRGFYSLVIPYFGKWGFDNFNVFKIFEYLEDNNWIELLPTVIKKRFILEAKGRWNQLSAIKNFIRERKHS
jgi:hypothetical protein